MRLHIDSKEVLHEFYKVQFSEIEKVRGFYDKFMGEIIPDFQGDSTDSLALGLDYLLAMDMRPFISLIKAPILLLHGEDDPVCPLSASEYIYRQRPDKTHLKVVNQAGHIPFYTQPEICCEEISAFLEGLPDG